MRSSSELFPVALLSAEIRGELTEDVYLLNPRHPRDPSVRLALTRLGRREQGVGGQPVVLLHGEHGNRRSWYSASGSGLAALLAQAGYDAWLVERRGHGLSPRNQDYARHDASDCAAHDLPAVEAFINEQNPRPAHWLGHGLGGLLLAMALGGGCLDPSRLASLTLLDSGLARPGLLARGLPARWQGWERQVVSARGRAPEEEAPGILQELRGWTGLFPRFGELDWWRGLERLQLPVLALAGAEREAAVKRLLARFSACSVRFQRLAEAQRVPPFTADLAQLLEAWFQAPAEAKSCETAGETIPLEAACG